MQPVFKFFKPSGAVLCFGWVLFASASMAAPPAPAAKSTPKAETLKQMSTAQIHLQLTTLESRAADLELEAEKDVKRRFHRLGYEKYRTVENHRMRVVEMLGELQLRERDLHKRIRVGRRIDEANLAVDGVRRMIELLRLYRGDS